MSDGLLEDMRAIRPGFEYYAITLTASEDGKSIYTEIQGLSTGDSKADLPDAPSYDLRAAKPVLPDRMTALWTKLGPPLRMRQQP